MNKRFGLGWKRSDPDSRDGKYAFRSPYADLSALPKRPLWHERVPKWPSFCNQFQTSSCVGWGWARVFHLLELAQGEDAPRPSGMFIYANARITEGCLDLDEGCQGRDGLLSVLLDGVCADSDWPLNPKFVSVKPSESCYEKARKHTGLLYRPVDVTSLLDLLSAIALGPVGGGISVWKSFFDAPNGEVPMPGEADKYQGGHYLAWVDYDLDRERLIFDNSWGGGWGRGGRGSVPFEYVNWQRAADFWALEKVT